MLETSSVLFTLISGVIGSESVIIRLVYEKLSVKLRGKEQEAFYLQILMDIPLLEPADPCVVQEAKMGVAPSPELQLQQLERFKEQSVLLKI